MLARMKEAVNWITCAVQNRQKQPTGNFNLDENFPGSRPYETTISRECNEWCIYLLVMYYNDCTNIYGNEDQRSGVNFSKGILTVPSLLNAEIRFYKPFSRHI